MFTMAALALAAPARVMPAARAIVATALAIVRRAFAILGMGVPLSGLVDVCQRAVSGLYQWGYWPRSTGGTRHPGHKEVEGVIAITQRG